MIESKIVTTDAPIGQGLAPSNAMFYVRHFDCFEVRWQLDGHGWACGYRLVDRLNPEMTLARYAQ